MKISHAIRKVFFVLIFILPVVISNTQTDSTKSLVLSGYIETYYSFDFANPGTHIHQPLLYSYYSINSDYLIRENGMWRMEFRGFSSKDRIFTLNDDPSNYNYFVTSS
ncbi:MAG: hypothetical protein ABI761_08185 [Saprospiraceae bacterium]